MQTVYYSLMRNLVAFLLATGVAACLLAQSSPQVPAPVHASIVDSHEGVTIGVEPWTQASRYKAKFPKKSPLAGGIVAIRVTFRNDNDYGVKVNLQRIQLVVQVSEDNRQQLDALSADNVADAVMLKANGKDPTAKRIPIPLPVGKPKPSRDANWTNFRDDCQNAAVPSGVLAAHSSVEGLLYFDLRGEMDLLTSARLYVPDLFNMNDNQPLSYFDVALGHDSSE
jgi:hypothetical protein